MVGSMAYRGFEREKRKCRMAANRRELLDFGTGVGSSIYFVMILTELNRI